MGFFVLFLWVWGLLFVVWFLLLFVLGGLFLCGGVFFGGGGVFFFPLDVPRVTPLLCHVLSKLLTSQKHKIEDEYKSQKVIKLRMLHNHSLALSACSVLVIRSLIYKLPLLRSPNFIQ